VRPDARRPLSVYLAVEVRFVGRNGPLTTAGDLVTANPNPGDTDRTQ